MMWLGDINQELLTQEEISHWQIAGLSAKPDTSQAKGFRLTRVNEEDTYV